MYTLANILNQFSHAKDIYSITKLEKPNLPSPPYLHPTTWETIDRLFTVVENLKAIKKETNQLNNSSNLNLAKSELEEIININQDESYPQRVENAQRDLIVKIAQIWLKALEKISK